MRKYNRLEDVHLITESIIFRASSFPNLKLEFIYIPFRSIDSLRKLWIYGHIIHVCFNTNTSVGGGGGLSCFYT